jgi:hypothetical protein
LKENNEKYEKLKNIINKKIQYINFCDADYVDELRDKEYRDNQLITRCEEFRHIVYNEIINLLNDKKDIVKKSHKKIVFVNKMPSNLHTIDNYQSTYYIYRYICNIYHVYYYFLNSHYYQNFHIYYYLYIK